MAWRLVIAEDEEHLGFEYVRLASESPTIPEHHTYHLLVCTGRPRTRCGIYPVAVTQMARWSDLSHHYLLATTKQIHVLGVNPRGLATARNLADLEVDTREGWRRIRAPALIVRRVGPPSFIRW